MLNGITLNDIQSENMNMKSKHAFNDNQMTQNSNKCLSHICLDLFLLKRCPTGVGIPNYEARMVGRSFLGNNFVDI